LAWYHQHHHFRCWPIKCCPPPKENELAQFQIWALVTKPLKFGATLLHLPPRSHAIQKVA
jgi:hypothetical protein